MSYSVCIHYCEKAHYSVHIECSAGENRSYRTQDWGLFARIDACFDVCLFGVSVCDWTAIDKIIDKAFIEINPVEERQQYLFEDVPGRLYFFTQGEYPKSASEVKDALRTAHHLALEKGRIVEKH